MEETHTFFAYCENCDLPKGILFLCSFLMWFSGHLQDSQQWLGRLIPDKQSLNDQLKQVQQNSLHREYHKI